MEPRPPRLIFILGIRARSGTNFVADLLQRHESCCAAPGLWEDRLISQLPALERYVDDVSVGWHPRVELSERVRLHIGAGLRAFVEEHVGDNRTVVLKTPQLIGLDRARCYFPEAGFVLLVRDGRAVAESTLRSFGPGVILEREARAWAAGAREVSSFRQHDDGLHIVTRYEDLVRDPETELRRIFERFRLDPEAYEYERATRMPVRGSSSFFGGAGDRPHWKPVPKDEAFNPLERAAGWSASQHRRFDKLAGDELELFGYERSGTLRSTLVAPYDTVVNWIDRMRRWRVAAAIRLRRARRRMRKRA